MSWARPIYRTDHQHWTPPAPALPRHRTRQAITCPPRSTPAWPILPGSTPIGSAGKDHYPADRAAGQEVERLRPEVVAAARANRAFGYRVTGHAAAGLAIRQFLDIGAGLPAPAPTHQTAQKISPACKVAYVDNDPLVLAHGRALLTAAPGAQPCAWLHGDVRDPDTILEKAGAVLDFTKPVAVLLLALLHFVSDEENPAAIVARFAAALAPGSLIAISHLTSDFAPQEITASAKAYNARVPAQVYPRSREQITALAGDLRIEYPGVVPVNHWMPRPQGDPWPSGGPARRRDPAVPARTGSGHRSRAGQVRAAQCGRGGRRAGAGRRPIPRSSHPQGEHRGGRGLRGPGPRPAHQTVRRDDLQPGRPVRPAGSRPLAAVGVPVRDHDGQPAQDVPGWRLWVSSTGRHWALRCTALTAAQVAAGARPLLCAEDDAGLAEEIRVQGELIDPLQPACSPVQGPAARRPAAPSQQVSA
jgi:hypothetical protein